jgi:hypothetical protein
MKKYVAFVLAGLAVCLCTQLSFAKVIHRWSFAKDGSDSVGKANAKLNPGATVKEGRLVLDGESGYVELPIGATIEKLGSSTFEAWVTWDEMQGAWSRIFDFGSGQQANIFLTPRQGNPGEGGTPDTPRLAITNAGWQEEQQLNTTAAFPVGKQVHVAVTIDAEKKVGKLYIDGKEVSTVEMTLKPSDLGNTNANYLGGSQYVDTDPVFKGSFAEFRIYDTALSADEIAQSGKAGPDQLGSKAPTAGASSGSGNASSTQASSGSQERRRLFGGRLFRRRR